MNRRAKNFVTNPFLRFGICCCILAATDGCSKGRQRQVDERKVDVMSPGAPPPNLDKSPDRNPSPPLDSDNHTETLEPDWVNSLSIDGLRHNRQAIAGKAKHDWANLREQVAKLPVGVRRDEITLILLASAPNDKAFSELFSEAWSSRSSLNDGIVGKWLDAISDRESLDLSIDILKDLSSTPNSGSIVGLGDLQRLISKQLLQHSSAEEAFARIRNEGSIVPGLDLKGAFITAMADESKPEQLAEFIDQHIQDLSTVQGIGGLASFAESVGFRDPQAYSGKINRWSSAINSPAVATSFAARWLEADSKAATHWMGELSPSPTLDGAIYALFSQADILKSADRATMEQWANKVSNPEIKSFVMKRLGN